MDRSQPELELTTSQVADLLHVHPSTVKRWCNDGELEFGTTRGGHRRIHLRSVMAMARAREIDTFLAPFAPYEAHVWSAVHLAVDEGDFSRCRSLAFGWLLRGRGDRVSRFVYELGRHPGLERVTFLDSFLKGFMGDVGGAWQEGRIGAGAEHLASQAMVEALLKLRESWSEEGLPRPSENGGKPLALVGAMEGDHHHLGALSARLVLEGEGWRVAYLGPDVPVEEFARLQRSHRAELVGISLTPPHTEADVLRAVRLLHGLHSPRDPYALVFGGGGCANADLEEEPHPFRALRCFTGTGPFLEWLKGAAPTWAVEGGDR